MGTLQLAAVETIESATLLALSIVHRPEPQPARGIDHAVVDAVSRDVRLHGYDKLELATRRIEMVQTALQASDEPAASDRQHESDLLGRVPLAPLAAPRIEA